MVAEDDPPQACNGVYVTAIKEVLPFADGVVNGSVAYSMLILTETGHGVSAEVLQISNGGSQFANVTHWGVERSPPSPVRDGFEGRSARHGAG